MAAQVDTPIFRIESFRMRTKARVHFYVYRLGPQPFAEPDDWPSAQNVRFPDLTPDRRVDRATDSRSVSVGPSAAVFDPGSRCNLRRSIRCPHEEHGDRRSSHSSAFALAKSVRGTTDRIDSPRVPGSRHRVERDVAAADSAQLFPLLPDVAYALSLGERHPGVERRRQTGERSYRCHCSGGRPAPSIRTARRLAVSRYHLCSVCALASTPPG